MRTLYMAVGIFILLACCTGCGAVTSKGIGFNGAIYGIDESQYSQKTEKKSQPIACLFSAKWCNDSEKEGS